MHTVLSSATKTVTMGHDLPFVIIGERLNPTGRKLFQEKLRADDLSTINIDVADQVAGGCDMLDVNMGVPLTDEPALLARAIKLVQSLTDLPICIDSSVIEALDAGLAVYEGKALVNSMTGEDERMDIILPLVKKYDAAILALPNDETEIPMLAKTHGQAATPTRLGKEIQVFSERIENQLKQLEQIPYSAKFGGATGNFNAHFVAFPEIDWVLFSNNFVNTTLGLSRSQTTTQIEHYDNLAALFDCLKRINTIILDLNRDMWTYISMDYFKQKLKDGEIGSSAMPHKVNPIDFENSEGNIGIANAVFEHLSSKLPVSRLQRDLTDSTVLRNIGVPLGHTLIALESCINGLNKLVINEVKIAEDLENNWAVVAEAIQTILRRENYPNPYEALKDLTRGNNSIDKKSIHAFIGKLKVSAAIKAELKKITPHNYTGIHPKF